MFRASTENVRELKKTIKSLICLINDAIRNNRFQDLVHLTKILATVYCCYAEQLLFKLIHTPYGLSLNQVNEIRRCGSQTSKWLKCIECAVGQLNGSCKGANKIRDEHISDVQEKLEDMVEEWIVGSVERRNRLAHGQFKIALNNDSTAVNATLTNAIEGMDPVKIGSVDVFALERLVKIIEDLIESPMRAHYRDYWTDLCELEYVLNERRAYSVASKRELLQRKSAPRDSLRRNSDIN